MFYVKRNKQAVKKIDKQNIELVSEDSTERSEYEHRVIAQSLANKLNLFYGFKTNGFEVFNTKTNKKV